MGLFLPDSHLYYLLVLLKPLCLLGMSTSWAESVFDPTWTRPADVGWTEEWPEIDRRRQSVRLVLGSSGDRVCSSGDQVIAELQNHFRSCKIITEMCKSSPKNVKTHQIYIKIAEICWEWPDLAKSHQIWLRTHWISSNLSMISPDLYITFVRSGGSGFGEENPPLDPPVLGLGCRNPKLTNGSVDSGWTRVEIGRVGRSGRSWSSLDTPRDSMFVTRLENSDDNLLDKLTYTENEAYNLYNNYALQTGFSIWKGKPRYFNGTKNIR